MTSSGPTVSVIMPLYNSADFMEDSVRSVLGQTFGEFELLLVDDCSTDNTLAVAQALAISDNRIRVVLQKENGGPGVTRNAGIAVAKGRYIAFLDSDDLWDQDKLAIQIATMQEKKSSFSYTNYTVISNNNKSVIKLPDKINYSRLLKETSIGGGSTVIYDTHTIGKRYFPNLRKAEDLALWLSILHDVDYAHRCGPELVYVRTRPGSVSSNIFKAAAFAWKVYRDIEKLPFPIAAYYFSRYALSAARRRFLRRFRPTA